MTKYKQMKKKENPFSYQSADDATGFLIWKTHMLWHRAIKQSLKALDLTHTQYVVLANTQWLILKNGEVTQIEIAQHAQIDVMMTSNVIRTLEKKEILTRAEHQTDTRAKSVKLTRKGRAVLKKAVKKVEDFDREFFSPLKNASSFNKELLRLLKEK